LDGEKGDKIMNRCDEFTERYTTEELEALNKLHTKQLLRKLRGIDICSEYCQDMSDRRNPECVKCWANQKYNKEQLKAILATREHIPNKQESKALRKERIKKGR
jgi:hypothetical protein